MWSVLCLVVLVFGVALSANTMARELATAGDQRFPWWKQSTTTPAGLRWGRSLGVGVTLLAVFGLREAADLGFASTLVFVAVAVSQFAQIAWHNRRVARLAATVDGPASDAPVSRAS